MSLAEYQLRLISFAECPYGPKNIRRASIELEKTEAGRLFLSAIPKGITFKYLRGDDTTQAESDFVGRIITLSRRYFRNKFALYSSIIHELAHQIQIRRYYDYDLRNLLRRAHADLSKHKGSPQFKYVSTPLEAVKTEESFAQDLTEAIFILGYGRVFHNNYFIPFDEDLIPAAGSYVQTLSPEQRMRLNRAISRMRIEKLPNAILRSRLTYV